uniref:Uncharacterized protein n=1 Tax=Physcomitrium patens TaxID=3218 RepID=A0A2K1IEX4_PHYPA|nr:hypothetical protein PHYPA_029977 [Physcomitrium patens]
MSGRSCGGADPSWAQPWLSAHEFGKFVMGVCVRAVDLEEAYLN